MICSNIATLWAGRSKGISEVVQTAAPAAIMNRKVTVKVKKEQKRNGQEKRSGFWEFRFSRRAKRKVLRK